MRSDVWLLILARDPAAAKSRLAPVLDDAVRADLAIAMLADVVFAAHEVPFARRLVVTESAAMRSVAATAGVSTLDARPAGTNETATLAFRAAAAGGASGALVLASDLPLIAASDLEAVLAVDAPVVISPDRHGRGTNALLLAPPSAIAPAFGASSFAAHQGRALSAGLEVRVVTTHGLTVDLDDPDDLRLVAGDAALGPRTANVLSRVRILAAP